MFLHTMVTKDEMEKIITRGISIIHTSIKTTINKLLATSVCNQLTANQLATTLSAEEVAPTNILGKRLERLMLSFYGWQRVTNVALEKLKDIPALKDSTMIPPAQVALIFKDDYEVLEVTSEQRTHVLMEHIARVWNLHKQQCKNTKNKGYTHDPVYHWPEFIKCKPNPEFAEPTGMTDQPPPDATSRKIYANMVKSFKTMDIGQKTTRKANTDPPAQHVLATTTKCKHCKCKLSHHSNLYSNVCSLKQEYDGKEVCYSCTHHKPHHFPEYVHCNRQPNNGTCKPPIAKKTTGQSIRKVVVVTTASDDIPVGLNNPKGKGVGRGPLEREFKCKRPYWYY
jgi:hypothetical protein